MAAIVPPPRLDVPVSLAILGLQGQRRRRAVIQMATPLRNLGRAWQSVALLMVEREAVSDALDDAVSAFPLRRAYPVQSASMFCTRTPIGTQLVSSRITPA